MTGLAHLFAGWPLAASLAMAVTAQALRAGRRRSALNQAMHELRRPLQAVALAASGPRVAAPAGMESSMQLAAAALERLDREINGGTGGGGAAANWCAGPGGRRGGPLEGEGGDVGWLAGAALAGGADVRDRRAEPASRRRSTT